MRTSNDSGGNMNFIRDVLIEKGMEASEEEERVRLKASNETLKMKASADIKLSF